MDDEKGSCIENPITTVTDADNCLVPFNCYIPINPFNQLSNEPWRPWNRPRSDDGGGGGENGLKPAATIVTRPPASRLYCAESALEENEVALLLDASALTADAVVPESQPRG